MRINEKLRINKLNEVKVFNRNIDALIEVENNSLDMVVAIMLTSLLHMKSILSYKFYNEVYKKLYSRYEGRLRRSGKKYDFIPLGHAYSDHNEKFGVVVLRGIANRIGIKDCYIPNIFHQDRIAKKDGGVDMNLVTNDGNRLMDININESNVTDLIYSNFIHPTYSAIYNRFKHISSSKILNDKIYSDRSFIRVKDNCYIRMRGDKLNMSITSPIYIDYDIGMLAKPKVRDRDMGQLIIQNKYRLIVLDIYVNYFNRHLLQIKMSSGDGLYGCDIERSEYFSIYVHDEFFSHEVQAIANAVSSPDLCKIFNLNVIQPYDEIMNAISTIIP